MAEDKGAMLKVACDSILDDPTLRPTLVQGILVTHCNQAARKVAQALGCNEFDDLNITAEDMCLMMIKNMSGAWKSASGSAAAVHALGGGLAFAAMTSEELKEAHAHIAVIYPQGCQRSGSLGIDVPMVANIGKTVGVVKSSQAFPVTIGEAHYWIWG